MVSSSYVCLFGMKTPPDSQVLQTSGPRFAIPVMAGIIGEADRTIFGGVSLVLDVVLRSRKV
jgi:hypothetical protein